MRDLVAERLHSLRESRTARLPGVEEPAVRYAERNGDYLAYTVFGSGSHDLAVNQSRTPIDLMWELPQLAGSWKRWVGWPG